MRRLIISKSTADFTSHAGLGLVGMAIRQRTNLAAEAAAVSAVRSDAMPHGDILASYIGLLCLGKSDFEAIDAFRADPYFLEALGLGQVPSAAADVTPMNNAKTKKEGVSLTYKGEDGFAPMGAYLGQEGYCLELELREGSQHCQKGTPELLTRVLERARRLTAAPLLVRLDSGNDAIENIATLVAYEEQHPQAAPVHYLIKWNPRRESRADWLAYAAEHGDWSTPRPGKRVALCEVRETRTYNGFDYDLRRVMRVIERTIDKHGQHLLIPDIEIDGWWTSLELDEETIIARYADHATSEQFHSEFKTDLDVERLPSGKFATNALVLACAMLAYNILRWIGQTGLLGPDAPPRAPAKRRRLRTVMQELMYVAARLIATGRRLKLAFGYGCPIVAVFRRLYGQLATP